MSAKDETCVLRLSSCVMISLFLLGCDTRPAGDKTEARYEYQEDVGRNIDISREEGVYHGKLDAQGNFIPSAGQAKPHRLGSSNGVDITESRAGELVVYEYRSGALIRGKFNAEFNFVPEIGSEVIRFEDYRYTKDAPRIYNLPGRFVEKKE